MVVGHFGIAELGKSMRRDLPLAWLVVAAYLPDIVREPLTLLTKQHEILSHSIPAVAVLALAVAALWRLRGGAIAAAAMLAMVCLLHWPADVFTGCKPTTLHGPWIGLVSYRRPVNDLLLELSLFFGGWLAMRGRGIGIRRGWLFAGIAVQVAFLVSMYAGSEFFIGNHEWMWEPSTSLVPRAHVLEKTPCGPPQE